MDTIAIKSEDVKNIVIVGRRWFQKSAGNTYHAATIYVNGEFYANTGEKYGYGDQYLETAVAILEKNGVIKRESDKEATWRFAQRTGIKVEYSCSDVKRRRDL